VVPVTLETGRLVVRRQFHRGDLLGRVWFGHVAADDERGLWLWVQTGNAYLDIGAADGRKFREVPFGEWGRTATVMRELTWGGDVLMFHPPGQAHSVWFFFGPDGFNSWYVNLEEPVARWDDGGLAGVDTVDQDLDVVVSPDRQWRWKDEEEFAYHLAYPDVYWVNDELAVRAEGERVVKLIVAGQFPFDGSGTDFRPDPSWRVPDLVAGWDRPRERRS
jgi:hypothetical protein